jgi:hypothetical protein
VPTISRSLSHASGLKATSISLSEKFSTLTEISSATSHNKDERNNPVDTREAEHQVSFISNHLWLHLQKSLLNRPTPPLQALSPHATNNLAQSDTDEILEGTDTEDDELAGR